ncbi:44211_t:CDS:2 [Gigaspora margarita]|uniref:44211_t:CDS:1 n=1 Tax=Gigaspora margarita TaxID=4874 RepID=A0ABN7VED8_GIGMA|nr:44211_t:CDS:2 [Gigaspora margarita]
MGNLSSLGDLFYIDLNQQFNASDLPFQLLAMLEHKVVNSAVAYKDEIIIFGRDESQRGSSNDLNIINESSNYSLNIVENTDNSTWPSPRDFHTAIDIYNTKTNQWSQKKANIIGRVNARWGHTATLTTNNQSIIIFGGNSNSTSLITDIAVLNLSTYIWTSITPFGEKPRIYPSHHTAILYNDYIIFAFGLGIIGDKYNSTNIVSILDISNDHYEWVSSYYPRVPNSNAPNLFQPPNSINIGIVVGSVVGSIIGVGLLIIIGYLIYSNNKLKKEIKYSGTQPYNDETNEVVDNK